MASESIPNQVLEESGDVAKVKVNGVEVEMDRDAKEWDMEKIEEELSACENDLARKGWN